MTITNIFDRPVADLPQLDELFTTLAEQYPTNTATESRLTDFKKIIAEEVGHTPLLHARNTEKTLAIRPLYLKFEGSNPTGTQKDRIAFALCADALRRDFTQITLATCGNYGVACALAAKLAGLQPIIYIPADYHTKRIAEMEELGATVRRVAGDYETTVGISQQLAADSKGVIYDANPGGANAEMQIMAYSFIADEIYEQLGHAPAVVASPVSNGTVLLGIYRGFKRLHTAGNISFIPKVVGGSAWGKNPIVASFLKKRSEYEDLPADKIRETTINEPLINWHSFDGKETLAAIHAANGWAANVSDKKMLELAKLLREKEGLSVLPAATAGLAALVNNELATVATGSIVAVLTSRR